MDHRNAVGELQDYHILKISRRQNTYVIKNINTDKESYTVSNIK
jgi:hypothetical protein